MAPRTTWTIAVVIAPFGSLGCAGLCGNTITNRVTSPDAQRDAVVFTRDCGATTAYSTQVSIVRAGGPLPNQPGNVFIAPDSTEVRLEWIGGDTLLVRYASANPNLKAAHVDGIAIHYAALH